MASMPPSLRARKFELRSSAVPSKHCSVDRRKEDQKISHAYTNFGQSLPDISAPMSHGREMTQARGELTAGHPSRSDADAHTATAESAVAGLGRMGRVVRAKACRSGCKLRRGAPDILP